MAHGTGTYLHICSQQQLCYLERLQPFSYPLAPHRGSHCCSLLWTIHLQICQLGHSHEMSTLWPLSAKVNTVVKHRLNSHPLQTAVLLVEAGQRIQRCPGGRRHWTGETVISVYSICSLRRLPKHTHSTYMHLSPQSSETVPRFQILLYPDLIARGENKSNHKDR